MKKFYIILTIIFFVSISKLQAQNDTIFYWKSGVMVHKRSIKPADLDSITFRRPTVNLPNVTICSQVWTTTNLNVSTYRDGTAIPQVTDPAAWVNLTTGAWCYYNNSTSNGTTYGKLYNWYAVAGIHDVASAANPALRKNLAPTGWHVPTDAEWTILTNCLGGGNVAGGEMKATTGWNAPNTGATNSSGFTGLPGGARYYDGTFNYIGDGGVWWSASENDTAVAWYRFLYYNYGYANRGSYPKYVGFSVRCLRD